MGLNTTELDMLDDLGRKHAKREWIRGGRDLATVSHEPSRNGLPEPYQANEAAWMQYRHGYREELHALNAALELAQKRTVRRGAQLTGRA